jgi:hypothetical protein
LNHLIKILVVIALSSVKFIGGPALAYGYRFNYVQIVSYTVLGGMVGVVIVCYSSKYIYIVWDWLHHKFFRKKETIYDDPTVDIDGHVKVKYTYVSKTQSKRTIFSPRSRRIVKLWQRYGLFGIAAITPILLSIPVGAFIASRFENDKEKIFIYMFTSILFWSLLIASALFRIIPLPSMV